MSPLTVADSRALPRAGSPGFSTIIVLLLLVLLFLPRAVAAAPPIRSAAEIDYPPFSVVSADGQVSGFSVELFRAALQAMERETSFRIGTWAEVRGLLEQGEVEALPLVGRTPEREELFDFTFPYMSLHGAIVVRADNHSIDDLEDLRGRRVAVMKGDNAEEFLRREDRGITLSTTTTFEEALHALAAGSHDAVVLQRLVALRLIEETGLDNLRVIDRPISAFRQDFCFAVKKGDARTLALLNEGLSLVIADGTYQQLHAKWFAALQLPPKERLVIGGDINFPPYEFRDRRGNPSGFVTELTRAVALEMGLNVEVRLGPWDQVLAQLEEGRIDAIQGMFYSLERDRVFDFSPPHLVTQYVAVVRRGQRPPAGWDDLADLRLVVQKEDVIDETLRNRGWEGPITVVDNLRAALTAVVAGDYDAALMPRIVGLKLIEDHGWNDQLQLGKYSFLDAQYSYAVKEGQRALLAQFSEGLRLLEQSGEYRRIHDKWLGSYQEQPHTLLVA
ncbi:MAG: transporter substrate-binding domain-containing protein, partial [Pelovirga sp.]